MRNVAALVIAIALFWLGASVFMRWNANEHADPAFACDSAAALLSVWSSQKVIEFIGSDGRDVTVTVDSASWLARLNKKARADIGLAAWCQVQALNKGGQVKVRGTRGDDFGRVVDGKWSSKLVGE